MLDLETANRIVGAVPRGAVLWLLPAAAGLLLHEIPRIENRTDVLILQHRRERFHPFNTARIVHQALRNSTLLVDHPRQLAARLTLKPRAGLLYPGPGAALISELPPERRPEQLVVLDGTWHQAKTLFRDLAALCGLPHYRLAPAMPGRYRIRREPNALALSTVEATVAALAALEPETRGLDRLLAAFERMVNQQLAHPNGRYGWRQNLRRGRSRANIPLALVGDLGNVVVAYGEAAPGERRRQRAGRTPISWVAERIKTGDCFGCLIRPDAAPDSVLLEHLELTDDHFAAALSLGDAGLAWEAFRRPDDIVAVFNQGTADLLAQLGSGNADCLVLKSVNFHPDRRYATLDELVAAEGLPLSRPRHPGRAGRRLANLLALVHHLHTLGSAAA